MKPIKNENLTLKLKLKLNPVHTGKANNFFSKYDLVDLLGDTDKKTYLGNSRKRKCRFCNKKGKKAKFKKDAHVIPELLGAHNLLSYFECDECNHLFAKYESSFSNFLGVSRTMLQLKGKGNKVPKYKDNRIGLEVFLKDEIIKMITEEGEDDGITINKETKEFKITTKRPGYIPIHIPKILIKIGMCMLSEDKLKDYEHTRRFLIDTKNEAKFLNSNFLRIFGYHFPGPTKYRKPFVHLYTKREEAKFEPTFSHILLFFFGNYQLQIILPFNEKDKHLAGKEIKMPIAPLLLDNTYLEKFGEEQYLDLNLTSSQKKSNENHDLTFTFESYSEPEKE